jgi:hypothetical protein
VLIEVWIVHVPVVLLVVLVWLSVPEIVCPSEKLARASIMRVKQRHFPANRQGETGKCLAFIREISLQTWRLAVLGLKSLFDQKRTDYTTIRLAGLGPGRLTTLRVI